MDFHLINQSSKPSAESTEIRKRKRGRTLVDLELLELVVVLQEVHLGGLRLRVRRRWCRCHQRCALRRGRADQMGARQGGGPGRERANLLRVRGEAEERKP
jgi:hypothetical protein